MGCVCSLPAHLKQWGNLEDIGKGMKPWGLGKSLRVISSPHPEGRIGWEGDGEVNPGRLFGWREIIREQSLM